MASTCMPPVQSSHCMSDDPQGFADAPSGRKRRRPPSDCVNLAENLQRREVGGPIPRSARSSASNANQSFRNMRLQKEIDPYDDNCQWNIGLDFLKSRSIITEIILTDDVIVARADSGLCIAFNRASCKRICFLNIHSDEVIDIIFHNKTNDSIITASERAYDNYTRLRCRVTPIEYIKRNRLDAGFCLFENETFESSDFIDFSEVNNKIITYSAPKSIYKFFDLRTYNFLYEISDSEVTDIKISPGILMLIYKSTQSYLPLKVLSIEDGTVMKCFNHSLIPNKQIELIELSSEHVLIKQENCSLQILDIRTSMLFEVRDNMFSTSAFIFLYEHHLFLTFQSHSIIVWNFRGEKITSLKDHHQWVIDCDINNIQITRNQDVIIFYCMSKEKAEKASDNEGEGFATGSIHMISVFTGKCLSELTMSDIAMQSIPPQRRGQPTIRSTVREALEGVSTIVFDEGMCEMYTANMQGMIHMWSS